MKQSKRILIVDDFPMTVQGYTISIENGEFDYSVEIEGAHSCDEVLHKMLLHKNNFYDMVLLDINLPASKDHFAVSGEDLGFRLRTNFPYTKIVVHTGISDMQRISNIFKTFNPEGFLIKSDIEPDILLEAVSTVMAGESYYSKRTNSLMGQSGFNNMHIDSLNRKILYYMARGEKMRELPKYIPLSMATIERRKKNLKLLFGIPEGNTKALLDIAREKGFI